VLTTVDVIWYYKSCRHCVSSIHKIVGYTQKIFVDWRSLRECIIFHHRVATITWLTITECHSWPWTFSVVKIMSSFLCLCQARSVQSHNYVLRGYRFYLLVRGWFWILRLFWVWYFLLFILFLDRDFPPNMSTHKHFNIRNTTDVISWAEITFSYIISQHDLRR
jgi:hypothetical protein